MTPDDEQRLNDEVSALRSEIDSLRALVARLHSPPEASAAPDLAAALALIDYELRTPISAIVGLADLMGRDTNLSGEQRENLDLISRSGEGLLRLVGARAQERPAAEPLPSSVGAVLIIDDEPANLKVLSELLGKQGYSVRVALDGESGVEAARFGRPDLILLDVMLPRVSGFDICRRLKDDPQTRDIPVVFLSALDSIADKLRAFASGAQDYITKPFQVPEVLARVQAQVLRVQAEAALRAGRARLQAILDYAPVGIALLDESWRPQTANQRWADLLGLSVAEAQQISLLDLSLPAEAGPRARRLAELAGGASARYQDQARLLHQDGSSFWANLLVAPLREDHGDARFVAILSDITEQKQAEALALSQRQSLAALRERERLARELHRSLGRRLGDLERQAAAAGQLVGAGQDAAARQLNALVQMAQSAQADLHEFLLGAGISLSQAAAEQPRSLRAALAVYLQEFGRLTGIPVDLVASPDLNEEPLSAEAEQQILRIAQEALSNARRHAAPSRIEVTLAIGEETLRLAVRDDGRGFVASESMETQGYGLRSMRKHAAEIGGELRIDSTPGTGTLVSLSLPLRHDARPPHEALRSRSFLLVDDQQLFAEGLRALLLARGAQVLGLAVDSRTAIAQARALQPDILLIAVDMPAMSGIEIARRIKAELPAAQIVLLGDSDDDEQVLEAIRSGASGFLLKRLAPDAFFARLSELDRGDAPLAPGIAARLLKELARPDSASPGATASPGPTLSPRQLAVLSLVARGQTYKQVAASLSLSVSAVRYHMEEIIKRLRLSSRAEAIAYAARLLPPEE